MQQCNFCGADLPENSRFCGKCGRMQDAIATDAIATRSNTPPPPSWSPNAQAPGMPPPPPVAENEDERRRGIPPWSPLYDAALAGDALLRSGQAYTPGAPVVQGTPQISSVPSVAGTPTPYTNAPAGQPAQGPTNAPISHPAPGPANAPVSHPMPQPQPTHYPPEPPGTQQQHPPHQPGGQHTYRMQQTAARATKTAGGSAGKTILLVVTAVVVVGAGAIAAAAHFLSHPQPLISISSTYKVGTTPAGANGTILHISGQQFASHSAITFLLDGQVAPGHPGAQSDANGNVSADVPITAAWSVGPHALTARDASNDSTQNSVSVTIVQPGQANTPGPDGAPPDDASFRVIAQIQGSQSTETEVVTGHPDPVGGTVCQPEDNGQPIVITTSTFNTNTPYRETSTYSCAGSYKGGKLTLTETFRSDVVVLSELDGTTTTCTLNSPQTDEQLSGSYTGNNTFSGTITYPAFPATDYSCNSSSTFFRRYQQVNWTGQVTDLHR